MQELAKKKISFTNEAVERKSAVPPDVEGMILKMEQELEKVKLPCEAPFSPLSTVESPFKTCFRSELRLKDAGAVSTRSEVVGEGEAASEAHRAALGRGEGGLRRGLLGLFWPCLGAVWALFRCCLACAVPGF